MKAAFGLILVFVAAAFLVGSRPDARLVAPVQAQRPNVVFIVVDDMNAA